MKRSMPCAGIRQNIYAASIVLIGNFKKFHYDFDFLYYSFSILNFLISGCGLSNKNYYDLQYTNKFYN